MVKSDEVKIKLWITTGFSGAKHKEDYYIDRQDWEGMAISEQEKFLDQLAKEYLHEHIDYGAYVEEEE